MKKKNNLKKENELKEFENKENRRCFITITATENEKKSIRENAKKYNMTLSAYLRKCHNFYCDYINNSKNNSKKNIK